MHSCFNRKHTESDKKVTAEKDAAQFELASHVDLDDHHFRLSLPIKGRGILNSPVTASPNGMNAQSNSHNLSLTLCVYAPRSKHCCRCNKSGSYRPVQRLIPPVLAAILEKSDVVSIECPWFQCDY